MGAVCAAGASVAEKAPVPDDLVDYSGPGPFSTSDCTKPVQIRLARSGAGSSSVLPPQTVLEMFEKCCTSKADKIALQVERPCPPAPSDGKAPALPDEEWLKWTYADFLADVKTAAGAFVQLGMKKNDSVNIWSFNSPEWFIAALGAVFAGGKMAGLYPTDTAETAAYKVVHSGGSIVVCEDMAKLTKLREGLDARKDAKALKALVISSAEFTSDASKTPGSGKITIAGCGELPLLGWKKMMTMSKPCPVPDSQPGTCSALIYTSGTTGMPKAVMISHDNILYESATVLRVLRTSQNFGDAAEQERVLSFLPLSHVAGLMVDIVLPMVSGGMSPSWTTVTFARNYDLKSGTLGDRLRFCKPTLFLGVPLVWEKIADKVRAVGASTTGLKKSIATWAKNSALTQARNCQLGGDGSAPFGHFLANAVLKKVRMQLGFECLKYGVTGAAPIRVDTLEYYGSLGININEVYGMSENTGAVTMSTDFAHEWGSCGWNVPGCELKAFKVNETDINIKKECPLAPSITDTDEVYQGELCFRGRNIMMGYMAQPALGAEHVADINKKNAETIDKEGYLHSGDKGLVSVRGMVKITGRYKELIIGEGGENIAPVPIEDAVKQGCDGIAEIMMVGDKRKYNVALVTLKAVGANGEVPGTDELDAGAARLNPNVKTISAAMDDKMWIDAITAAIKAANENGKVCPMNAAKIQKFTILAQNFSEQNGELTPTKKLKRKVAEGIYKAQIDKLYAHSGKEVYVKTA
mmetsp:Transcript_61434/g.146468  ORF Transcript_61434/g.146468 Transcript_61434/m.146468 type:complete len:752 (+) Transcript_61434:82-2337(+)